MVDTLTMLDARGILLSVISKSDPTDVKAAFEKFGLGSLFVFPQVGWDAKSVAMRRILRGVRFAPSACVFVDDTPFERDEVASAFPEMTVVAPEDFPALGETPRFVGSSRSEEGKSRKDFYREEEFRQRAEQEYEGTFREFLQSLGLEVTFGRAGPETTDRIVELVQRTNQINFSTHRYSREEVVSLLASSSHLSFVASAEDKYGKYGIIGFACVQLSPHGTGWIQDLMLSCRIQGRGVESALICTLAGLLKARGMAALVGLFRPTRRNGHISSVYRNLGFDEDGSDGDFQRFRLSLEGDLPRVPPHVRMVLSDSVASMHDEGTPFVRKIVEQLVLDGLVRGDIIDIGAGWDGMLGEDCDEWLTGEGGRHIRLDMERYPRTDIVANAQHMPEVDSAGMDTALCLDVLEHCTNPFELSSEMLRVLRPGGTAVISAPMNYVIHDHPGDFWRFTPDGLKLLFKDDTRVLGEYVEGESDHPIRTVLVLQKSA